MEKISFEQFKNKIKQGEKDFINLILENMNLENYDLSDMNFSYSNFINANLSNVNFYSSQLVNVLLDDCNLQNANLKNANLERASLRRVNLTYADIRGAKLYAAVLENAILDNIIFDDKTENFRIHCPEQGAFVAYKKGLDNLIIKLLIPSDAKRVSSTLNCCRCDKAKVLEIKNFEGHIQGLLILLHWFFPHSQNASLSLLSRVLPRHRAQSEIDSLLLQHLLRLSSYS